MRINLIKVKKEDLKESPKEDVIRNNKLDMVIAFDTTSSMSSYIGAVKKHVKELVPELFKQNPDLRIGVVAFGDYCDMSSEDEFGKAYQVCELTDNENKLIEFITNAHNTNGGDSDEFYELVIKKIVEETNWREGSTKVVLLIADARPHKIGCIYSNNRVVNNQIDWREEAKKAAKKGIKFDTLTINNYEWYKKLSKITKGVSAPFNTSSKISHIVKAAAMARRVSRPKLAYKTTMDSFVNDAEMSAVYATYSKEVIS